MAVVLADSQADRHSLGWGASRGAREQVQWTCESGERRELKRAAGKFDAMSNSQNPSRLGTVPAHPTGSLPQTGRKPEKTRFRGF